MIHNPRRALCLAAVLFTLASQAQAKKLDTLFGSLELPFDFQVKRTTELAKSTSLGFTYTQWIVLQVASGPLKDHETTFVGTYYAPTRVDAAVVQGWVREAAEEAAAKPGTTDVQPVQLAGFPFEEWNANTQARTTEAAQDSTAAPAAVKPDAASADANDVEPDVARTTWLEGSINNAVITIGFSRQVNREFDAPAAKAVREINLDFASILKLRSRYDQGVRIALIDKKMVTPVGEFQTVDDAQPRVIDLWQKMDGQGRMLGAKTGYIFFKPGFWTVQRLFFSMRCDTTAGQDPKELKRLREVKPGTGKMTITATGGPAAIKLGGLDGTRVTTEVVDRSLTTAPKWEGVRWFASDHNILYGFEALSAGGESIYRNLITQANARPLSCQPKAMLGGAVVAPTAPAAPAAPVAPASGK